MKPIIVAFLAASFFSIHEENSVPVVSLADPSRTDPYAYRYVVVNSKQGDEWAIVVDRDKGVVLVCTGRLTGRQGLEGLSECVEACPLVFVKSKGKR